jgi:hypothetical protein
MSGVFHTEPTTALGVPGHLQRAGGVIRTGISIARTSVGLSSRRNAAD